MAEPRENERMEKIVSLCKRRGFIFQSSEIYGGIQGFWDYGPLGAELKRNVKELWWNSMTRLREDVVGLDATIIMAPQIWRASGHVDTFSDPMCDCLLTKKRFRADQIEPQTGTVYHYSGASEAIFREVADEIAKFREGTGNIQRLQQLFALQKQKLEMLSHEADLLDFRDFVEKQLDVAVFKEQLDADVAERYISLLPNASASGKSDDCFSVLLPPGKPPEKARTTATEYYKSRGIVYPKLIGEEVEQVTATTAFNPENGAQLTPPRPFNLMLQTWVGPIQSDENVAYLRPETAQAIFAQFKNVHETSRQKIPFGIAQVGKAFRNEVTPRNFTFRSREFEQMELEFFIKPDEAVEAACGRVAAPAGPGHPGEPQPDWGWQMWHQYWVEERIRFYGEIGLPRTSLEEYWQKPEELAHYARATVDILFKFPFGTQELEGIAARSDFDLSQHERFSGKPMGVFDEELRTAWAKLTPEKQAELRERYFQARLKYLTKSGVTAEQAEKDAKEDADGLAKGQYIPHVIEPSAGADRLILALICQAYDEVTETDAKGKAETRVILRLHPRVAPIKVAVLPLLKNKPDLVAKARAVFGGLRGQMNAFYDDGGSIGRRYARQDEVGTPFCVTIDFDTLGEKPELLDTVTVRHRDDGRQERIAIADLPAWLLARVR